MTHRKRKTNRKGITLIEILVSIAVIAILTVISVFAVGRAREAATETSVRANLSQLQKAIQIMEQDTGKWPNGCPPWSVRNPEVDMNAEQAGLLAAPSPGNQGDGCVWTEGDISGWQGPYVESTQDPWGNPYWFVPNYAPYENCSGEATQLEGVFLVSQGQTGAEINARDCDDIFIRLR